MNRRKFIKRGAILCPAIVGLKAYPQALTLADPATVPVAAAAGCPTSATFAWTGTGTSWNFGSSTSLWSFGIYNWSPASSGSVCRVKFTLTKAAGSITAKTFYAQVYTISGNAQGTLLGESDGVAGSDSWSLTNVSFEFATPASVSSGTNYIISITMKEADAANYARGFSATQVGYDTRRWDSAKAQSGSQSGHAPAMEIYVQ